MKSESTMEEEHASAYREAYHAAQRCLQEPPLQQKLQEIDSSVLRLEADALPVLPAARCSVTWERDAIAYKCRDCQSDASW